MHSSVIRNRAVEVSHSVQRDNISLLDVLGTVVYCYLFEIYMAFRG